MRNNNSLIFSPATSCYALLCSVMSCYALLCLELVKLYFFCHNFSV
nr:MAG TPA: hypothetical protein [Caudoviricetes sp.]